jgi:hypothetical protein
MVTLFVLSVWLPLTTEFTGYDVKKDLLWHHYRTTVLLWQTELRETELQFQVTGNRTTVPSYGKQNYSSKLREIKLQFQVTENRTTVPSYGKQNYSSKLRETELQFQVTGNKTKELKFQVTENRRCCWWCVLPKIEGCIYLLFQQHRRHRQHRRHGHRRSPIIIIIIIKSAGQTLR